MNINMSQHFTTPQLFKYSLPSIAMVLFTSIYGVIDGVFIANYVGVSAFAAVNIILPYIMILSVSGFMIGTGGSALVSKIRGEGNDEKADAIFTQLVIFTFLLGLLLSAIGWISVKPVSEFLGASGQLLEICIIYGQILLISLPFFTLQYEFQAFFSTAGKPQLGFLVIVAAGVTNIVLDAVFMAIFGWGIIGAGAATVIGEIIGGALPIAYFSQKNSSLLRFRKFQLDLRAIGKACVNGSSEMIANIAVSLLAMVYSFQLMRFVGENGVAAFGILYYASMIFFPLFVGFNLATSPIISFQYGAGNVVEIRSLLIKSLRYCILSGILMFTCAQVLAAPVSSIFCADNNELYSLAVHAFRLLSIAFIFAGLLMFGSSFFTALNNGFVSAFLSFVSTLVFELGSVLILPEILGINGIWISWPISSFLGAILSVVVICIHRKRYSY